MERPEIKGIALKSKSIEDFEKGLAMEQLGLSDSDDSSRQSDDVDLENSKDYWEEITSGAMQRDQHDAEGDTTASNLVLKKKATSIGSKQPNSKKE